jgi:hypothetical protein
MATKKELEARIAALEAQVRILAAQVAQQAQPIRTYTPPVLVPHTIPWVVPPYEITCGTAAVSPLVPFSATHGWDD